MHNITDCYIHREITANCTTSNSQSQQQTQHSVTNVGWCLNDTVRHRLTRSVMVNMVGQILKWSMCMQHVTLVTHKIP